MIHYVLLKFKENQLTNDVKANLEDSYNKLVEDLEGFENFEIYENCMDIDKNMDLMIEIKLSDQSILNQYLKHPIHLDIINKNKDILLNNISFDRYKIKN